MFKDNVGKFYNAFTLIPLENISKAYNLDIYCLGEAFDEYYLDNIVEYYEEVERHNVYKESFLYCNIQVLLNRLVGYSTKISKMGEPIINNGALSGKSIKREDYRFIE